MNDLQTALAALIRGEITHQAAFQALKTDPEAGIEAVFTALRDQSQKNRSKSICAKRVSSQGHASWPKKFWPRLALETEKVFSRS